MRRPAGLIEVDDPFGLRGVVQGLMAPRDAPAAAA